MERRDEITAENAGPLAERIAQTLDLEFADQDSRLETDGHEVLLEIPCPSPAIDNGVWIRWEGPEGDVIVGFHTQHSHFGPWDEFSDQEARMDAILRALGDGSRRRGTSSRNGRSWSPGTRTARFGPLRGTCRSTR